MKRLIISKILSLVLVLVLFSLNVSASVSLNVIQPTGTLEVIKDQTFNILVNISCSDSDCNNVLVGLKIPNLENVTYDFVNNSVQDCFGGTCLARPAKGPPYNISGNSNWGCGKCSSNPIWIGIDMRNLAPGCASGMATITGVDLCFETNNGENWNIIFSEWPVGGAGNLVYTRSIERGILSTTVSTPFYLNSGGNPLVLNLAAGNYQLLNFSVKASGNPGYYSNLVAFASDQDSSPRSINILELPIITPPESETSTSSGSSHRSSSHIESGSISITEDSTTTNSVSAIEYTQTVELTGQAIESNNSFEFEKLFWWFALGIVFIVLLIVFLLILFKKRSIYY